MNTYSKGHMYNLCKSHMKQNVLVETHQGEQIHGVIIDMDDDHVYIVTPVMLDQHRQFSPYGYGYGYGYPGFGLRRLILPLTAIAALSLLPWY
ncbi:hypothetical protein [Tenuibacillus multivorans]|uniref:Uncharacterized protein n=1 Tax=Tenuibacillus multivorans TaxID=237069 RepID=A0A1G9ZY16_9BACI|nr:hypothetical protein [Tenuibacillus multivorans]GEL76894.1 hypothetical protein TMU01_11290 [Tenuibacillus multivorans]SDN26168.1 hypothetical protein SAMN05216498_1886 [Tenuibacillus multivorans]